MDFSPTPAAPETIFATLRTILRGLMAALGGFGLEAERGVLLHRRIGRIALRLERMLMRFRAGRLRSPAKPSDGLLHRRRPAMTSIESDGSASGAIRQARRTDALPRKFGWLVQEGRHRAAYFSAQLETVLHSPEMADLLAASPQAGRLLRPLCRALGVEFPANPPRNPSTDRTPTIRKPRPRRVIEPFRIKLPRGVLSAARRQGFGKLC